MPVDKQQTTNKEKPKKEPAKQVEPKVKQPRINNNVAINKMPRRSLLGSR